MSVDEIVLLSDETPIVELDELRPLIADGQERGFLTFAEIETCLEEVEVTKEQVQELHAYLDEQGIDGRRRRRPPGQVRGRDASRPAPSAASEADGEPRKKVEVDLTVEPSARLAAAVPAGRSGA